MARSVILGFFDGVHTGHRAVINSALDSACGGEVILVTLKNSPSLYFNGGYEYILPRHKSYEKIKSLGVNEIIELEFGDFVSMTAIDFIKYIKDKFCPNYIVSGFNHTFGFNKSGTPELLESKEAEFDYRYVYVPPMIVDDEIVSSSLIKQCLKIGNIEKANSLLESEFELGGTVIHGAEIGRTIGFPTANIIYPKNIVEIPYGVYAVDCIFEGNIKRAIMNWGMKPTLNNNIEPVLEVHVPDFSGDLYDRNINVKVLKRIRCESKFSGLSELKEQIKKDVELCLEL